MSVVVPVHDAGPFLRRAIDSILGQTFTDYELIVVDDGSTDDSPTILADYARRDARVRVVRQAASGIVVALNHGLSLARAPIIGRMDGDDVMLPTRLEKQMAYLDLHPACVLVGTGALAVDDDEAPIAPLPTGKHHTDISAELLRGRGSSVIHASAAMRKRAIDQVGGYREEYAGAEDLDLFLRLGEVGEIANLDEMLLLVRRRPSSYSASVRRERTWNMRSAIVREAFARRGLPPRELDPLRVWHPEGPDEHHFTVAMLALLHGNPGTFFKHTRALVAKPGGARTLARIVTLRVGPHVAKKYAQALGKRLGRI